MQNRQSQKMSGWDVFEDGSGAISFWVKPSYNPGVAAKIRSVWDFSRYHSEQGCGFGTNKSPFGLWFLPTVGAASTLVANPPRSPRSMLFGMSLTEDDQLRDWRFGSGFFQQGTLTGQLAPSDFDQGRWTHVIVAWQFGTNPSVALLMNGRLVTQRRIGSTSGRYNIWYHDRFTTTPERVVSSMTQSTRAYGCDECTETAVTTIVREYDIIPQHANTIRLGNPSQLSSTSGSLFRGNFAADATYDEFFVWRSPTIAGIDLRSGGLVNGGPATNLWRQGRYSREGLKPAGNGWLSAPILSGPASTATRGLPTAATASGAPAAPAAAVSAAPQSRIRGVSFTWYGEMSVPVPGPSMKQVVRDYNANANMDVTTEVTILKGGALVATCTDDGFSLITTQNANFNPGSDVIRYGVRFRASYPAFALNNAILLATPIFDDVTIYYTDGTATFLEYRLEGVV